MGHQLTKSRLCVLQAIVLASLGLIPQLSLAGDLATGKNLYQTNCLSCHGATGDGKG
ncbi:MAG: c-type cytochrome, partial [Halieaceae bacterium]|nr:c-type cytochrome [Halieaceae bacterium]